MLTPIFLSDALGPSLLKKASEGGETVSVKTLRYIVKLLVNIDRLYLKTGDAIGDVHGCLFNNSEWKADPLNILRKCIAENTSDDDSLVKLKGIL